MIYTPSANKLSAALIVPKAVVRKFQTGLRPEMYSKGSTGAPLQREFFTLPVVANRYQWDIVTPDGDLFALSGRSRLVSVCCCSDIRRPSSGTLSTASCRSVTGEARRVAGWKAIEAGSQNPLAAPIATPMASSIRFSRSPP
jgi:hypothetical protein